MTHFEDSLIAERHRSIKDSLVGFVMGIRGRREESFNITSIAIENSASCTVLIESL